MATIDEILAGSPLAGLRRVSPGGGDREVVSVCLAERFAELGVAPAGSLVLLSRSASAEASDYRLDMALRWAAIHQVAGVAAFSGEPWHPPVTVVDIAVRAGIALIWLPPDADLARLVHAIMREIGGGAEQVLGRAEQGLAAVLAGEEKGEEIGELCARVGDALGTPVAFCPAGDAFAGEGPPGAAGPEGPAMPAAGGSAGPGGVSVPVMAGDREIGHISAPAAHGDLAIGARLVLHAAASAAARLLDFSRQAREVPARSRSELLAELLMSDSAVNEDLLDRARELAVPVSGWHVAVRIEADDLADPGRDEVQRFELLESAGQVALHSATAVGGSWYLCRLARAIVLVQMSGSNPGPQAGARAARTAGRALAAISRRLPALHFRAGVGTPHEGPLGLRASAAEARGALLAARVAGRPPGVAAHDAVGVQRMLMEWYASDTARASVRDQLAPLEKLGPARAETAIQTLAVFLDQQGSIVKTAQKLHLHRNAVANRLRGITELLEIDLDDPDQRLALQLACRARLLYQ